MLLHYLVEWKGYEETGKDLKWVSADDLNAPDAIASFHTLNPDNPGPFDKLIASDYHCYNFLLQWMGHHVLSLLTSLYHT